MGDELAAENRASEVKAGGRNLALLQSLRRHLAPITTGVQRSGVCVTAHSVRAISGPANAFPTFAQSLFPHMHS